MTDRVTTIRTYDELYRDRDDFCRADHPIRLLGIIGSPGLGKTRIFKDALGSAGQDYLLIENSVTEFSLYEDLHRIHESGIPILFNDVEGLLRNSRIVSMLLSLCDSEEVRRVSLHRQQEYLDRFGLPKSFEIRSRVCVLANELPTLRRKLAPLFSRGVVRLFRPTVQEVHRYVGSWKDKAGIEDSMYQWIGDNLHQVVQPDSRDYLDARDWNLRGRDWRAELMKRWHQDPLLSAILEIQSAPDRSYSDRVEEFRERTGKCERTYCYRLKRLREERGETIAF